MDATDALESIVKTLPGLPAEAIEDLLVTFDALVGVSDADRRPNAARLLRDTALLCDEVRKSRLLAAAAAVEAGEPCAMTPGGLTWKEAAAAQTVTMGQWQARSYELPSEDPPDAEDPPEIMEQEPPKLPRLRVRHFFPGLVIRVRREIRDVRGRVVVPGQVLHLLTFELSDADGGETTLSLMDRTVRLDTSTPDYAAILANGGNRWFQPVPSASCLEDLCEAIDRRLTELGDAGTDDDEDDEDDEDEDYDDPEGELVKAIREDVERCQDWLSSSAKRGRAPRCETGPLAARVFGRDHELAAWIPLLFAGMEFCNS